MQLVEAVMIFSRLTGSQAHSLVRFLSHTLTAALLKQVSTQLGIFSYKALQLSSRRHAQNDSTGAFTGVFPHAFLNSAEPSARIVLMWSTVQAQDRPGSFPQTCPVYLSRVSIAHDGIFFF